MVELSSSSLLNHTSQPLSIYNCSLLTCSRLRNNNGACGELRCVHAKCHSPREPSRLLIPCVVYSTDAKQSEGMFDSPFISGRDGDVGGGA